LTEEPSLSNVKYEIKKPDGRKKIIVYEQDLIKYQEEVEPVEEVEETVVQNSVNLFDEI
jgi:hypothetical protein